MISIDGVRILDRCRDRGIQLRADRGQIRWRAPAGAMDLALMRQIKAHQPELLETLEANDANLMRVFGIERSQSS